MSTKMITGVCRFSYLHVWEAAETPSGDMKYSASILIPTGDKKTLKDVNACIQAAIKRGIEKGKFTKAQVKGLRLPLRNGQEEFDNGDKANNPEYKGMMFLNASSTRQPGIVGPNALPVMDQDDVYSGMWGRADINFFPYNAAGNRGVGVGLNNVMKIKDDERLDGRMKAEDAFADYKVDEPEGDDAGDLT